MPQKSGKQAWHEIRSINTSVKAIFKSGYSQDINSINLIAKPLVPSVPLNKASDVLDA